MKRLLFAGAMVLRFSVVGWSAEEKFSQSVTREDFAATGLQHLSSSELARLDELILAYKNGDLAAARRAAAEALQATQAAEVQAKKAVQAKEAAEVQAQVALAAQRSAEAETKVAKAAVKESRKPKAEPAPLASAVVIPGAKIEYADVKSTIAGQFRGWEDNTVLTLTNGQRWKIANGGSYYTSVKENVEVQLLPSSLGGYWMKFPALDMQVRVKLVTEK